MAYDQFRSYVVGFGSAKPKSFGGSQLHGLGPPDLSARIAPRPADTPSALPNIQNKS